MHFYEQYPNMRPFVGKHFQDRRKPSVLLIGESHYLPEASTVHMEPKTWYEGSSQQMTDEEIAWTNIDEIIRLGRDGQFSNKAHSIWRNSLMVLNSHGPRYSDFVRVAEDIACYNFYLRPAYKGCSLQVTALDVEFANEAFRYWCQDLKPTIIVFLSTLAHRFLRRSDLDVDVPIISVPHPACPWWNRVAAKYGGMSGRQVLAANIESLHWPSLSNGGRTA